VDERLFGWSHSAKLNAPSTSSASGAASHFGTPDVSDDEEEGLGDYEDVIGYLHNYEQDPQPKGSKSHRTSYADLQLLRHGLHTPVQLEKNEPALKSRSRSRSEVNLSQLAPVYHNIAKGKSPGSSPLSSTYSLIPSHIDGGSGPPSPSSEAWPHIRRQRKKSLSDGVSVDRIGALSPVESFKVGTEGLNSEIQEARTSTHGKQE
jgi:glycerol-3-phosphate O-acyltransferase/dihydroxyacetone phosphate acyltransferase